jgi:formylglycine-generating enzyme required for sulfatase activity
VNSIARPQHAARIALISLLVAAGCTRGAPSCRTQTSTCGSPPIDDCCRSLPVPGGTFERGYDGVDFFGPRAPASVSDFHLDRYEVTVGRFRTFVRAGFGTQSNAPQNGTGAHRRIAASGWSSTWNQKLATSTPALTAALKCHAGYQTWTDTPESNENKPINCLDWYTAFAFCAWDGGRLPTEAEWSYAAFGGSEQRYYPWSSPPTSTTIDDSYAVYCGGTCQLLNVGSKSPKGDGRWGQADLGGNAWEWTLDTGAGAYPMPCQDCADVSAGAYRAFRSGSNDDIAATLRSAVRHLYYPEYRGVVGVRCARDP